MTQPLRKRLPQKINILRRASVFNRQTREEGLKQLAKPENKKYLLQKIKEDWRENLLFRNYEDYLISVWLELEGIMERFRPLEWRKVFTSRQFLEKFKKELRQTPPQYRLQKIGVFDTETTDIHGYIVSYAFVTQQIGEDLTGKIVDEVYQLLNPDAKISTESQQIHKISMEELKDKPRFAEIKEEFLSHFAQIDMAVGHNLLFDMGVVKRELERVRHFPPIVEIPIFDTMYFSIDLIPLEKKKMPRLEEAVEYFFGKQKVTYHNALDDVKVTLKLFNKLIEIKG
ncbi:MAG: 3'-5' exonuclease [Epsilonproteobacteria bacterium]|nr:3'-5' exonuclease [Campylobacterota bacterium]NPA89513.1 3'-5' exonuclease [Campylobacterota bacterium]